MKPASIFRHLSACAFLAVLSSMLLVSAAFGDVPGRPTPAGPGGMGTSVPNPGSQQQELPNITFPAPYNVFEFVVTCIGCHGGSIDQTAGHGSNWGGSNMASAMRDPVFRANQVLVNNTLKSLGFGDGAGNVCMRCHSSNGWLSGRFDPLLGGAADGSDTIESILLSTDTEGISCEMCHRVIGAVTMMRPDLDPGDPVWNMILGLYDWPHLGLPYPEGPGAGNPYGDATLQFHDGMGYGGKYSGSFFPYFSDIPLSGYYTGQTYGIYPPGWPNAGDPFLNPDGSYSFQFDLPLDVPKDPGTGLPDYQAQSISVEHPTRDGDFIQTSEFCGACHDLTVPMLNHGMPEQRTYTEWKYSDFSMGPTPLRCQDCHMPTMKHEYSDDALVTLNPDPALAGWWPWGKDRNPDGGTAFHKLAGANRDLPQMMKVLYPEVDLEVIGAPTGHDPTIFPGMLSDRGPMWDRATRNTEIGLRDAAGVEITQPPTVILSDGITDTLEMKVQVTNYAGHRIPSGYPDGRRMWIGVTVVDDIGGVVYESGVYDQMTSELCNDSLNAPPNPCVLTRALSPSIDSGANAVMIYERATCMTPLSLPPNPIDPITEDPVACIGAPSSNLINKSIAFDNRLPPAGFTYADYRANGVKFFTYAFDGVTYTPYEEYDGISESTRYPDGQNWDEVTYTFTAPTGAILNARAELYWQTHTREFMEHLKEGLNDLAAVDPALAGPSPEGPPSPLAPNYPLTPTYLRDNISLVDITDLDGNPLGDNWGGLAYASWLLTGQGAPFLLGAADTSVALPPAAPANVTVVSPIDPATGIIDPFVQIISWDAAADADGYLVWVRYGTDTADPPETADWDRLAVVYGETSLTHEALNPGKTFQYSVEAFNAAGTGPASAAVAAQTPGGLPVGPINTQVTGVTDTTVTLTWFDQDFNEVGFVVERQDVPVDTAQPLPNWLIVAYVGSQTPGAAAGSNIWTDGAPGIMACPADVVTTAPPVIGCYTADRTALMPGRTYNYQISAYNQSGMSPPDLPVAATTIGPPPAPTGLVATVINAYQVDLSWLDNSGGELGFRVERALDIGFTTGLATFLVGPNVTAYSDFTVVPSTTYYYRVAAFNSFASSFSNTVSVTTPGIPPAAPTNLVGTPSAPSPNPPTVTLTWTDNAVGETGFRIERALDAAFTTGLTLFVVVPDTVSFLDSTTAPKATYYYRVFAFSAAGFSLPSNTVMVVTPGEIPQAPSNLTVMSVTKKTVTLQWTDNATNETSFEIQRATDAAFTAGLTTITVGPLAGTGPVTFAVSGLKNKTTYWFRVRAVNADGASAFTPPVSGSTSMRGLRWALRRR